MFANLYLAPQMFANLYLALQMFGNLYLALGILAMLSIGSKKTVLAKRTSGIQRPQTTWAQRPSSVCLNAPPCTQNNTGPVLVLNM